MTQIAVIDYGMGNLRSVVQALRHAAPTADIVLTDAAEVIQQADKVVFPGQGAMPDCMRELTQRGLRLAVEEAARNKPFLGICIGLQMLFEQSEEGDTAGLGIFAGQVKRFPHPHLDAQGNKLKVPHMGWNHVSPTHSHPLWHDIETATPFYFVHSYFVQAQESAIIAATTDYPTPFCSAIAQDNLFAVQFHPEKSSRAGLQLLANFAAWNGQQ